MRTDSMSATWLAGAARRPAGAALTDDEWAELSALLDERRRDDMAEAERVAESLGTLLASRSEATADDEHDPEGPSLGDEWSRLQMLRSSAALDIAAVEAARERMLFGEYGTCIGCARPIGIDRLRARPTTEFCIACAIAAER